MRRTRIVATIGPETANEDTLRAMVRAGLDVARALPDARVLRLEGCGHAMLSERPNEVLDALIGIC